MSGDQRAEWPVSLSGVTECVVTTRGENGWNVAALGLFADDGGTEMTTRARTWGSTRTRRGFQKHGEGYVQFTRDPVDFVEAACSRRVDETPILDSAEAWTRVSVEQLASDENDTEYTEWELVPVESVVERCVVPSVNRGYYAVIEATIAASRLDVPEYDTDELRERIAYFQRIVDRCGGRRERDAWNRFENLVSWREQ